MGFISSISQEKARFDPESVFDHPVDIVNEKGLTRGQKLATLTRWRGILMDRIRATSEGMAPPDGQTADEASQIEEIARAEAMLSQQVPASG
jgi:hypothetical protein